jgi:hypothetical protein
MKTSTTEEKGIAQPTTSRKPKPTRKAKVAKRGRHGASVTAKPTTKVRPAKKTSQRAEKASSTRGVSKTAQVLALLKRPGGATLQELMAATGWQPHSVRGLLSGTVRKKMGLAVNSSKGQDGDRTYSVKD